MGRTVRRIGRALERAFRYGLTDAAVVWHNWQRWGYDYRLPEIYPPNPEWGTEKELQRHDRRLPPRQRPVRPAR